MQGGTQDSLKITCGFMLMLKKIQKIGRQCKIKTEWVDKSHQTADRIAKLEVSEAHSLGANTSDALETLSALHQIILEKNVYNLVTYIPKTMKESASRLTKYLFQIFLL